MRFVKVLGLCLPLVLTGCSLAPTAAPISGTSSLSGTSEPGLAIHGKAYGGQQPVVGMHVYLYAAGTGGYGTAATSLLVSGSNTTVDGSGHYYVTTDSGGNFSITGDYTCTTGTGVYLYAVGGNSGSGSNTAIGLLAALGACPVADNFASATPFVSMNEVSTIAAAYSMAGYATDATHVSSSGTTLAVVGVQKAFANAANLASISTGQALATTPAGNGVVPQTEINTLANILASCINSSSPSYTACTTLFSNAMSAGSSGSTATDTATAAIYMAHNPGANIAALYPLATPTPPFAPALGSAPNDFTIAINITGGGLNYPVYVAIDASGNAWIANTGADSISEFSSAGVAISPSTGYTGGGLNVSGCIAIDASGNAWVANDGNNNGNSISEFSSTGVAISPSTGYTGGGDEDSYSIAIDASGNVWVTNLNSSISKFSSGGLPLSPGPGYHNGVYNSGYIGGGLNISTSIAMDPSGNAWVAGDGNSNISEISNSGSAVSPSTGYTGGGLNNPFSIALDASGNAWTANESGNSISKFSSSGSPISSTGYTGGGLSYPESIAIDGSGNAWTANYNGNSISKFSSSGSPISSSGGYTAGLNEPYSIAIDGSGNAWVANNKGNSITEFIGVATPVATPLVANLIAPYSTPASKP